MPRPVPAGFKKLVQAGKFGKKKDIQEHYKVSFRVARRWLEEEGLSFRDKRTKLAPSDLQEVADRSRTKSEIAGHYGVGKDLVARWLAQKGIDFTTQRERPLPSGFQETVERLGVKSEIADWYQVSTKVVERWLRESDLHHLIQSTAAPIEDITYVCVRGAAAVIQSAVSGWSREMGMTPSEATNVTSFDVGLIVDEVAELVLGIRKESQVECLDALADIVYTCFNVAYRRNLPLSAALGEVHRSNETKTPNADGKPTKGDWYEAPDLEKVLKDWKRFQGEIQ
jgi:transposase